MLMNSDFSDLESFSLRLLFEAKLMSFSFKIKLNESDWIQIGTLSETPRGEIDNLLYNLTNQDRVWYSEYSKCERSSGHQTRVEPRDFNVIAEQEPEIGP